MIAKKNMVNTNQDIIGEQCLRHDDVFFFLIKGEKSLLSSHIKRLCMFITLHKKTSE